MKRAILTAVTAFTTGLFGAMSAQAQQETLTYDFVQGGVAVYPSFEDQDFVGVAGRASYALTNEVFVFGGLRYLTDDLDLTTATLGLGYRVPVTPEMDIYAGVSMDHQDFDIDVDINDVPGTLSIDDTALGFRGGARYRLDQNLEFGGELRVITGDLDYVGLSGYVQYFFSPQLGLIGEVDLYDGELGLIGGIRYNFSE